MTSEYNLALNFNNNIPVKTDLTFKQGDKGITLNLATSGLDTTGTTAHIVFKRSNGTSVEAELTGQSGPAYSYTILGNEFEIPGVVVADLKLYNGDTQRVSTASFIFLVTGDTMDGVGGGTGGYSDQLEQLSEEFEDTLNEYKDAFGDVGAVNPCGAYDSTADYNVLDLVSYQGSSYLCRTACKNKVPTNTTYWQVFASGSGGVDYNDVSNKPSINSVTLSGNKTTADLGLFSGDYDDLENKPTIPSDFDDLADVDMARVTDGQVPTWDAMAGKYKPGTPAGGGGGTNPNLLINGWFTVNQRGFTSETITSEKYTVDRWVASGQSGSSGTFAKTSSGFSIAASSANSAYIQQRFEDTAFLNGETVTMSVMFSDGTIKSGTAVIDTSSSANLYDDSDITLRHSASVKAFQLTVKAGKTKVVKALKLEIGSASTLHLDTAPDYTTELLKCQRYYRTITQQHGKFLLIGRGSGTTMQATYILPVQMRALPTVTTIGTIKVVSSNVTAVTVASIDNQNFFIGLTSSYSASEGSCIFAYADGATSGFIFDAEL